MACNVCELTIDELLMVAQWLKTNNIEQCQHKIKACCFCIGALNDLFDRVD